MLRYVLLVSMMSLVLAFGCGGRESRTSAGTSGSAQAGAGANAGASVGGSPQCGVPEVDASDGGPSDGGGDEAQPDGSLPACSWPAPVQPSDAGLIVVAAGRTVLWCGVGNDNDIECLSTSATECTPEAVYDYAVCNYQQCSPCMMLCAPNEYGIGVGGILSTEGPQVPVPSSSVPSNCRSVRSGMVWPVDGRSPGREWSYSCCPCE